jgi:zinc protease
MKKLPILIIALTIGVVQAQNPLKPDIERWQTKDGMKVAYMRVPNNILNINLTFDAGAVRDESSYGLASLTNNLVTAGGKTLNLDSIANSFDFSGAVFSNDVRKDYATLNLQLVNAPEYFDTAFNTLLDVIAAPNITEVDFSRIKNQQIQYISYKKQDPSTVAFETFFSKLYDNHPYSHPTDGTLESLSEIDIAAVQKFYKKYYNSSNAILVIVGDVNIANAKSIASKISDVLPKGDRAPKLPKVTEVKASETKLVFPASQATLVLGKLGITPQNTDLYGLDLATSILGGGLDSRLMKEIREKRGLVYGASSFFVPLNLTGPYVIMTQTAADNAGKAVDSIHDVVSDFVSNGVSEKELSKAKSIETTKYYTTFTQNSSIANALSRQIFYGLPSDYLEEYANNLSKVGLADINSLIKEHMSLDKEVKVIVGPNE